MVSNVPNFYSDLFISVELLGEESWYYRGVNGVLIQGKILLSVLDIRIIFHLSSCLQHTKLNNEVEIDKLLQAPTTADQELVLVFALYTHPPPTTHPH